MDTPRAASVPEGYHTVTPFVVVKGAAELLDFTREAFGAEEMGRVGEDGAIGHAETRIGDSVVMMFDAKEGWLRPRPSSVSTSAIVRPHTSGPWRPEAPR